MKQNCLKEWWNAICYPMPVLWATKEVWENFAEKATYSRVRKAFALNGEGWVSRRDCKNLKLIARRLAKGNNLVLSDEFLQKHKDEVLQIDSLETVRTELKNCQILKAQYLVDKDKQLLGICLDAQTVITSVVNTLVDKRLVSTLLNDGILPTEAQMKLIGENLVIINRLLEYLAMEKIETSSNYWVGSWMVPMICGFPWYKRPANLDKEEANLLFVLDM